MNDVTLSDNDQLLKLALEELNPDTETHWMPNGAPNCAHLTTVCGFEVTPEMVVQLDESLATAKGDDEETLPEPGANEPAGDATPGPEAPAEPVEMGGPEATAEDLAPADPIIQDPAEEDTPENPKPMDEYPADDDEVQMPGDLPTADPEGISHMGDVIEDLSPKRSNERLLRIRQLVTDLRNELIPMKGKSGSLTELQNAAERALTEIETNV